MEGLTPEEQEEYTRVLKQGNRVMKFILVCLVVAIVLSAIFHK